MWDLKKEYTAARKQMLHKSGIWSLGSNWLTEKANYWKHYHCSLASAAILLCCYLLSPKWPEREINSTDFYCHQLTKLLCLCPHMGVALFKFYNIQTWAPIPALQLTGYIILIKYLNVSESQFLLWYMGIIQWVLGMKWTKLHMAHNTLISLPFWGIYLRV